MLGIACGAGEELRLWQNDFAAAGTVGIDPDAHACGDAQAAGLTVHRTDFRSLPRGPFDRVLCVDAAYHLSPRAEFLCAARGVLREGGAIAFTDLVIDGQTTPALRATARLCGIDPRCLLDVDGALRRLRAAGFAEVHCERLDEAVLGGFARFTDRQGRALGWRRWQPAWLGAAITAGLIPGARARGIGYALFRGTAVTNT